MKDKDTVSPKPDCQNKDHCDQESIAFCEMFCDCYQREKLKQEIEAPLRARLSAANEFLERNGHNVKF